MLIGYNTNGFAHHRLEDAIVILADIGYRSIALTLDHHALNPYDAEMPAQRRRVAKLLEKHNLRCVIETGARFLLDPRSKHRPTLLDLSPEARDLRLDFLTRAIDMADALHANAVSFWSGVKPRDLPDDQAMARLIDGCRRLLDHADRRNIHLAFEPEPGMFIDTTARFAELHDALNHPLFGLTLDIGHVHCRGDGPIAARIAEWQPRLFNVHIEDMRRGVHDHLPFGQGEIDFPPVLAALREITSPPLTKGGPRGVALHVELPRHSHDAVNTARAACEFLLRHVAMP